MVKKSDLRLRFVLCFVLIGANLVAAQKYSGSVIDKTSGDPVANVLVSAGHSEIYTRTDINGKFTLSKTTSIGFTRPLPTATVTIARWNFRKRSLDLSSAPAVNSASVYSLNGKKVFSGQVPLSRIIKLPYLAKGTYLLELRGAGGKRDRARVVLSNEASSFAFRSASLGGVNSRVAKSAQNSSTSDLLIFRHDNYYPYDIDMAGSDENMRISLKPDERSVVFNQTQVREYRFTISRQDSLILENQGWEEKYVRADMKFDGAELGTVGLRYKGSEYTLPRCFGMGTTSRTCPKISFKVKFTEYDNNKRFYGMKKINLHAMAADGTKMHDMLAYELYRDMGIYAPRTSYANVYVNNNLVGLFVAVEDVDGKFTKSRWPTYGDGNLYKETWPTSAFESHYINGLKTNNDMNDNPSAQRMVSYFSAINSSNEQTVEQNLAQYMDFDYFLRYMAVDVAVNNWDGIRGWYSDRSGMQWASNHNYYLYEEENVSGRIWLVPWDMDNTFWNVCPYFETAGVPQWNETPPHCGGYPVWGRDDEFIRSPNCDKLTKLIASAFWNRFVKIGEQFLNDRFASRRLIDKITAHAGVITEFVKRDPTIDHTSWVNDVNTLKEYLPNLAVKFSNHIHSIKSEIDSGGYLEPYPYNRYLRPTPLNNFEFTPTGSVNWVQMYKSNNSDVSVTHNTQNPLYGTADLRFDFTLRSTDAPKAYDVWCVFQPEFESPVDFSNIREIHIAIRSDRTRNVRIALNNHEAYSAYGASSEYGWDGVQVTAQTKTLILKMLDIKFPDWAENKPDIKEEALKSVKQLIFSPQGRFDGNGFLAADPDIGYLQIDNIRFVY